MSRQIAKKWRPPLWFVLTGVLGAVLVAPIAGILALRVFGANNQSIFLVIFVIVLGTAILGWLLWRLILRPVTSLARRTEAIRDGNKTAREPLDHYGTPELVELGQSVLNMAQTLNDRETNIRNYTDHITHEIKAPLSAISGAAELLTDSENLSPDDRVLVGNISRSAMRMDTLLVAAGKMAAAREPGHIGKTCLSDLALSDTKIKIHMSGENTPLPIAKTGLEIILGHLIENAVQHGARNLNLGVAVNSGQTSLTITDDGNGISAGNRARIFEPFFTTKREAGGTGMGLVISQSILSTLGAEIVLLPSKAGTKFQITF